MLDPVTTLKLRMMRAAAANRSRRGLEDNCWSHLDPLMKMSLGGHLIDFLVDFWAIFKASRYAVFIRDQVVFRLGLSHRFSLNWASFVYHLSLNFIFPAVFWQSFGFGQCLWNSLPVLRQAAADLLQRSIAHLQSKLMQSFESEDS